MEEVTIKNLSAKVAETASLVFEHLPRFAMFIKENCLIAYIQEQLLICREAELPMLKFFGNMSDEELISMSIEPNTAFLTSAIENTLRTHIERSLKLWAENQLVVMKREDVTAEDIVLAGYIRKKALLKFVPLYTNDINEALEIIKEIDTLTVEGDLAAANMYILLLKDRISEQAMLTEQNRDLYKKAQTMAHIGNWSWDLIKGKIEWSDELYEIYGLSKGAEITFDEIMALSHPEDVNKIKDNLQRNIDATEPIETYYRTILKDGQRKILHAKTEVLRDATGKACKLIGIIQDVTEKQLLIERLQTSEILYKQAQAISHIGNWSWDLATKKLEWSDELYHIYGLEPQSVDTSATIGIYNHPDDMDMVRETIKNSIVTLEPFDFNYRIVLKNGVARILNAKGEIRTDMEKKPVKIYGTVQDITEQKNIEKRLKDTQEFIQKITDTTPSIIAAYNVNTGRYSFINSAIEKELGYPPSKIMEDGAAFFISIIHPDDLAGLMEQNAAALEEANRLPQDNGEPIVEFKYRMKNIKGEYRWFHTYGTIFERDKKGLVESVLNITIDITIQEEAEQALFQKNREIQQSNTNLEEYAFVASHDLKEPLRKIATFSDRILITQADSLNADGKGYLNKVIDASRRMQKMINDLLYVSTITGNKDYQVCDLNTILQEAISALDYKIEELHAVIEVDKLPSISVVPSQFVQLFQNLINNSLKFVRYGVEPHIKITYGFVNYKSVEHFDLKKAKKYLQIEFQDNGIGFDEQYADKIFAIFQRLHGKNEYDGTGIGLAVCKKIVENHNGIIFANGKPNKGATFTIIIPV